MQKLHLQECSISFNENGYLEINNLLKKNNYSSIYILVDEQTNEFCLPQFLPQIETNCTIEIIEIETGEEQKNIQTCLEIWNILSDYGADRKSVIINLGGGVITDLGGFIAATFKRGIDFINVPTTLLAMVDAAIGGKNGVDLGSLKNQIGVIQLPKTILVDFSFLKTLPQNQMRSGLAEMLKHGLIYDKNYWNKFKTLDNLSTQDLNELIYESIQIKLNIVSNDINETGLRKTLNFGHTLGHAIESHFLQSSKKLLHGEAIAIGMILESFISFKKDMLSEAEFNEINMLINSIFPKILFTKNDINELIKLLIFDKKNEYGKVNFVLLEKIGQCKINQGVDNQLIIKSFENYLD